MSEYDTVNILISLGLTTLTGVAIAAFFRYKVKPKFEIVFDSNRQSNLRLIFSGLEWFDKEFESFYKIFERDMVELTKDNEEIIPRPKFKPMDELDDGEDVIDLGTMMKMDKAFQEVKKCLEPILKRMSEQHNAFLRDYHIYLNYLHDSFLRDINNYYFTTTYYVEWVLKQQNYYSIGIERKEIAKRLIEYVEKDSSIDKKEQSIENFILKWKSHF